MTLAGEEEAGGMEVPMTPVLILTEGRAMGQV